MSTKIHAAGDALGNPLRLIGSPGQRNDIAFAHELVDGFEADVTIADKGYDADHLCEKIAETRSEVVIQTNVATTPTSTRSATSSSASSTSSNSSAAARPDTTSCSPTSCAEAEAVIPSDASQQVHVAIIANGHARPPKPLAEGRSFLIVVVGVVHVIIHSGL